MSVLADLENRDDVPDTLDGFACEYADWVSSLEARASSVPDEFRETAAAHIQMCRTALHRIRHGIRTLRQNDFALRAFCLANAAMMRQQHHARLSIRELRDDWVPFPEHYGSNYEEKRGFWRSFQLAFVLIALPSFVPDCHQTEIDSETVDVLDLVDLIWFPTGGGKTEAYLGLAAFSILMRRFLRPDDAGCTVLMRYTLRLLTAQQFQRAASLICALELMRRDMPDELGATAISVGLFVGKSLTPNSEADALKELNKVRRGQSNPFQLLKCPWCGTELDRRDALGYVQKGKRQVFRCPASMCPFSGNHELPVCVVDESLYHQPPTLLIGTVDKFAMLAWRPEARALFGDDRYSPPALIIQDELHLISGPLGSMVGLYEGALDLLCRRDGRRPKIVASTATIRRAREQCKALFAREMHQFPPPGLEASDSYFAVESKVASGRTYLGFLPTAASSPLTAQIRAFAAITQGLPIVADAHTPDEAIDPYWTPVQYFGSLKELGRAATLVSGDIPEYLPAMQRRYGVQDDRKRYITRHEELTGRKNETEIPKILKALEVKYERAAPDPGPLDTLLATNMISVGMDVPRLGAMMVITQPKSTSEYIQASSRVGRSSSSPGLVLVQYNAGRPRDRSHYEQFRAYHDAYYRHVEPTSVTPFALSALNRGLHAVLVVLARLFAGFETPSDFDSSEPRMERALNFLRSRVEEVDPSHLSFFDQVLQQRIDELETWSPATWGGFKGEEEETALMYPAGSPPNFVRRESWAVPTSMRNVDVECNAATRNVVFQQGV